MREIVFDTETTGLNPREDRLTEIGALEVIDRIPTGATFHRLINPERDIPEEVTRITGHTREKLANEPTFIEIADAFVDFVGDAPLVAHNAAFDRGFVNAELERHGRAAYEIDRFIDTLALARTRFPGAPNTLDALCKRFSISLASREFHGALIDARLLADVYLELTGGRERGLDFEEPQDIQPGSGAGQGGPRITPRPSPRPSALSEEERARHRAFLETLPVQALWLTKADAPTE